MPDPAEIEDELSAWDYELPAELIARTPATVRSASRLLRVPLHFGEADSLSHHAFSDLPTLLRPGDLIVANDSKVMAARLSARRATGGAIELVVLDPTGQLQVDGQTIVPCLARPARKLRLNDVLTLDGGGTVTVAREAIGGIVMMAFANDPKVVMAAQGVPPLPPYLERPSTAADVARYQTVYAAPLGSAAAPTAGLHFDQGVLDALDARDIGFCTVTLHVGIGTFRNLRPEDLARGALHQERYIVPEATASRIEATQKAGGRIVAVGTTVARTLESATRPKSRVPTPGPGETTLFVRPPYTFAAIDGLVTNFHLPRSSLLMLVGALCGRQRLLEAYGEAVRAGYRFYSYGDAMLLL